MSGAENPSAFPSGDFMGVEPGYGMTMRDWFAGQALGEVLRRNDIVRLDAPKAASEAYRFADAMLAAREQGQ